MDRETLRAVQLIQLEILTEVDRVCRDNDIKYWLAGGTQLGAVRHQGFIPWDDDLDIAMKREDYERFMRIAPKKMDKRFVLQNWDTERGFGLPFTKIRKANTRYIEAGTKNASVMQGIYIDLFPYDNLTDDPAEKVKLRRKLWHLLRLILMKQHYTPWKNDNHFSIKRFLAYIPYRIMACFSSADSLKRAYSSAAQQYNANRTDYMYNSGEPEDVNTPMHTDLLSDLVLHDFEDKAFFIPRDYDTYLKTAYGNYMKLPPENERENMHSIEEVKY